MLSARLVAVAALAVFVGCDLPTDPVPTNPYDPLFDGPRIATSPEGVTFTASTPSSVSIAWTDRSSFESGIQVQRALGVGSFATIATLPPDANVYTDTGLNPAGPDGTADRRYRVVALADGGRAGAPSDTLTVRFPVDVVPYAVPSLTGQGVFSDDGGTLFATGISTLFVSNTVTGGALATLTAVRGLLSRLRGDRVLITESTTGPNAAVRVYERQTQQSRQVLTASGPSGC
ncbi:MAG TPA: fibronectin type III domain-containing protein, partial [Rubricoccaceae bacterium]